MPKRYNIRWKPDDNAELRKAVKNFNAKISRLEKKNPEQKNALPDKVTVKQMKELIETRQDLKREINALKRFSSKRGSEEIITVPENKYNVKITKWQKEEMTRRAGVINRRRKKRLEEIQEVEMSHMGKPLGYKRGDIGMGKADEVALRPIQPFTPSMNRADLKKKYGALLIESREQYWNEKEARLKENVMNGIKSNYGSSEYKEDVEKILDAIENMDFKEFYKRFMSESDEMEIISPPPGSISEDTIKANIESLKSTWIPNEKG